jgi:SAM-dependent methyltransferase
MSYLLTPERAAGGWYTDPHRYAFYQERIANLRGRVAPPGRVLVAGCGFGYLVDESRIGGYDAWGVDLSSFAINGGSYTYPTLVTDPMYPDRDPSLAGTTVQFQGAIARNPSTLADRFRVGDCRSTAAMATLRQQTLGGPTSRRFDIIVSEDLLAAQETDAEVVQCLTALRGILANNGTIVHIVTCITPDNEGGYWEWDEGTQDVVFKPYRTPDSLWKTLEQWKALVGTDTVIRSQDFATL